MNAGRILRNGGYDTEAVRIRLAPVDPDGVNVWPASSFMRALWRPRIQGITIGSWVFVHPDVLRGDRKRLARLVIHELIHVRQYIEQGYLPFSARYIRDFARGRLSGMTSRDAYLNVAAEREAREQTKLIVGLPGGPPVT